MHPNVAALLTLLSNGLHTSRQLAAKMGVSQPTVSRAITALGDEVVRLGAARSIQYILRDTSRGLPDIPVYRVDCSGRLRQIGTLTPVGSDGFVMRNLDGNALHSEGLPWWLFDMRPQGFLGRAYALRHGAELGLPDRLSDWTDTHALKALLAHGHDVVGNLLLGNLARDRFLNSPLPHIVAEMDKLDRYTLLAEEATRGDIPGSSAGGEQPKFTAFVETLHGTRHVLVKFTEREAGPVSERWRDLLLAEHLALETLRESGIPAAQTRLYEDGMQRFLEIERFDRIDELGRRALFSLDALDAEFVGAGGSNWPTITRKLTEMGHVRAEAAIGAELLWAFGTLIGNTDMHSGNLSFISDEDRPYDLAPAYDMTPMAFAPRSGGGLPDSLPEANLHASVANEIWRSAQTLARNFVERLENEARFSQRFQSCILALRQHVDAASSKISRLG